ncbi:MAG: ATP synthase subunit I, partial [Deltaproteobacteria bacterium]|nr:ATP synthase subunit I [Deltaproteobacteria bacterium]
YCNRAMFYAIAGFFILFFMGQKDIGKGLVLGALFSVLNFVIMGILLDRQIAGAQNKFRARSKAFLSIFFRLTILAIPLVISYKTESINFYGAVAGIFMVQFTILFNNLVIGRFFKIRKA